MSTLLPKRKISTPAPMRDTLPRRLMVTASVAAFAIRDWSLWVLLRDGPWGPPMRLVLGTESVTDSVERVLDALLMWSSGASLLQLKAGWLEQHIHVWGSTEQGSAVSLIHSMLLRANRHELRPNLHMQPIPSLHVKWVAVSEIETGQRNIDPGVEPGLQAALYILRSHVQSNPEIVLRYLADMSPMRAKIPGRRKRKAEIPTNEEVGTSSSMKEPDVGDGILTLAEATLLYRAFFPPEEPIDLANLRKRFLATNKLEALHERRPVRGREVDQRRVSQAYRYIG